MINTQILELCVKLGLWTIKILKERPVSMLLLAPPEHGKTDILKEFAFVDTAKIMTDFNTFAFMEYVNDYLANKKRTIIIPDFLKVVKKKYSSQQNALTILNAITEEGWIGKLPLGQTVDRTIYANVLTSLTQEEMRDKRHKWAKMGFLSRFVPLSYTYMEGTKELIMEYIKNRIYRADQPFKLELKPEQVDVTLPKEIADKIQVLTTSIMLRFKQVNFTGFRLQKQLQTLAMANALMNNRSMVLNDDYMIIKAISKFINFDFNPL